jgi:hypothetical protein
MNCPKCGEDITVVALAEAIEGAAITLRITMSSGCLLSATTLGKVILDMGELLDATEKSVGTEMVHFITDLNHVGDEFSVTFLSANVKSKSKNEGAVTPGEESRG